MEEKPIKYTVRKDARAKQARITIYGSEDVVVTVPARTLFGMAVNAETLAREFIEEKREWVLKQLRTFERMGVKVRPPRSGGRREYLKHKEAARALVKERLKFFNQAYGFSYGRISIRNQKTRWGSCTRDGNLNFNYKLALLKPELADYVIVHELCHLKEFNHSPRFWKLVEQTLPNYKALRKEIQKAGLTLG